MKRSKIIKALIFTALLTGCKDEYTNPDNRGPLPDPGPDIVITNHVANRDDVVAPADVAAIPGGTFKMGLDTAGMAPADKPAVMPGAIFANQKPVHSVTISTFKLMKKEVTVAQYRKFVDANPDKVTMPKEPFWGWTFKSGNGNVISRENLPIVGVTWKEAKAFADWMGGRLPTEAEWEYAARVPNGTNYTYSASNSVTTQDASKKNIYWVWCYENSKDTVRHGVVQEFAWMAHKVGTANAANAFGLYDMAGNVMEWCSDWYGENYYAECGSSITDPQGPPSAQNTYKTIRGGSWFSSRYECAVYTRGFIPMGMRSEEIGFRIVMP